MSKNRKRGFSPAKRPLASESVVSAGHEAMSESYSQKPDLPQNSSPDPTNSHQNSVSWQQSKFRRISSHSAQVTLLITGFAVYAWGLHNQFVQDDVAQLVSNPLVHSLGHLGALFGGSTFYGNKHQSQLGLVGVYYRPLMLTVFAVIYSMFGSSPVAYHLVQLLLYISCSFLVFLVFRYFFKPGIALALALIFLVDPINSQEVYYISNLQEPLYFFFGMLGVWLYLRFQDKSPKYLIWTALSLFVATLGKETALLFFGILLVYAWITDRKRCGYLALWLIPPAAVYAILRLRALGLHLTQVITPIGLLSLPMRLINIPSIVWFYLNKTVWPWQLITYYYWAYKSITWTGFVLPLLGDIAVGVGVWCVARYLRQHRSRRDYILFGFFTVWFVIGLVLNLQIIPLDETASDTWLMISLVGFLGSVGVLVTAFPFTVPRKWLVATLGVIVICFGFRSALRAQDWSSSYAMALADVRQTNEDWVSDAIVADADLQEGKYESALTLAKESKSILSGSDNNLILGHLYFLEGDYPQAQTAYMASIKSVVSVDAVDQMAQLQLYDYNPKQSIKDIETAMYVYPKDGDLWTSYGLLNYKIGNIYVAQDAVLDAYKLKGITEYGYNAVEHDQPVGIDIMGHPQTITPTAQALANPGGSPAQPGIKDFSQ